MGLTREQFTAVCTKQNPVWEKAADPFAVNTKRKILMVSKSSPGRVHDYSIFNQKNTAEKLPRQSAHYDDCGYDGASNDY